jgi:hypothetical protein
MLGGKDVLYTYLTLLFYSAKMFQMDKDNLLTTDEAAAIKGVTSATIINWAKAGRIPGATKKWGRWFIPRESLEVVEPPRVGRPKDGKE